MRRSERELERALEDLDEAAADPAVGASLLGEHYPDDVVALVHRVARDLMRIAHHHPDEIVNAPTPEATMAFLEYVREEYGIEDERDDAVCRTLETLAGRRNHWQPVDSFSMAPIAIAKHDDVATDDGDSLSSLVAADQEREAEELLVRTAYNMLAARGGRPSETP